MSTGKEGLRDFKTSTGQFECICENLYRSGNNLREVVPVERLFELVLEKDTSIK